MGDTTIHASNDVSHLRSPIFKPTAIKGIHQADGGIPAMLRRIAECCSSSRETR